MTASLPAPAPLSPASEPIQASMLSDAELATRAHHGDGSAFELIMRRYNRRLFRLARSLLRDDAEAEDVPQEAYLRAYTRLGELVDRQALAAWLARIIVNEALRRLRATARVISLEEFRAAKAGTDDMDCGPASDQLHRPGAPRRRRPRRLLRLQLRLRHAHDQNRERRLHVAACRVPEGERAGEAAGLSARPRHPLRPTCARSSSRGVAPGRNTRVASPATPTHATSIATRGSTSPTSTG
jgi:RNA polymerase sigma factor (sigma-70 family)